MLRWVAPRDRTGSPAVSGSITLRLALWDSSHWDGHSAGQNGEAAAQLPENEIVRIDPYTLTSKTVRGAHHIRKGVLPMLRNRKTRRHPVVLRHIARTLLRRADSIADHEQKRMLDRQAFALVQVAIQLQLASDSRQGKSSGPPQ